MRAFLRSFMYLVALAAVLTTAWTRPAMALDHVILRINFTPWAMHSQYFAGIAQGFYQKEGIELEVRSPSAGQGSEVIVGSGREQFGVSNVDSFVKAKANGIPVIAIMADQPNTPAAVITLKSSGISTPSELRGKRISWFQSNSPGELDPLLKAGGLTRQDIIFVTVTRGAEIQLLAAHQVDALFGYSYSQSLELSNKGFPVNVMALKDYGLNIYGTLIYTNEALLKSNPDLVRRFVKATLESLIWTQSHQAEAVSDVIKVAPDRDQNVEAQKLAIIYGLYDSPDYAQRFGAMSDAKWQSSIDAFAADIPTKPAPQEMYTNQFVDSLPEAQQLAQIVQQHPAN